MTETSGEFIQERHPLLESLNIPEKDSGKPIGTLILCGQGPVQDSATKVKLESLDNVLPGSVSRHEANTWMRFIARATGELDREGDIGLIIPSGRDTGGKYMSFDNQPAPTEADLMRRIIENLYGQRAPQSNERFSQAQVELEQEAKNTLFNVINAANIIDARRAENPNDPNLENVWLIGSHFHGPRLKILASLFGFDPDHVLSAEDVLIASSGIKEQQNKSTSRNTFNREEALQKLIQVRLSGDIINEEGQDYFERKAGRAEKLLDKAIDKYFEENGIQEQDEVLKRQEIKSKLFIEEQKDAKVRMRGERRWVRGLAMEADYVLPLSVNLKDDNRLCSFLLKFDEDTLKKYGIERKRLEEITPQTKDEIMKEVRGKIDPNRWSWQVVKSEWENEEYPESVKIRFSSLGIPRDDIESLSKSEIPPLGINVI